MSAATCARCGEPGTRQRPVASGRRNPAGPMHSSCWIDEIRDRNTAAIRETREALEALGALEARQDVTHSDGREVEVVRDLDAATARRLVEHELAAGRTAYMRPAERRAYGTIR